ncbi:Protein ALP1-like [Merluccius polli]|uniref:Protein ALP1-like n=1 Tax=Merluccius polli TaxID=89951 RepID=A0AA47PAA9_MERPO|nr:Protein ALP1-like [Merluccius polli]
MREEVRNMPFVSVMVDETTDVSNTAQMSYVLRYTTDSGVKERFFQFGDVCTVYERREELLELFEFIVDNHNDFDDDAVHSADGYTALLTGFEFSSPHSTVFAYSDVLFGILQNKEYDMQFCLSSIEDFCSTTERERDKFDSIYEDTVREVGVPSGCRARRVGDVRAVYQQLHSEILDNILTQLRNRFKDHEKIMFFALLDPKKFASYKENFPNSEFQSLAENYRLHFDLPRLKTELAVMYNMANFEARSPSDLLHFLTLKELTESMPQLFNLTCLVLTIPALKCIKTHARNSTGQDCLGALTLLSIEKGLLLELKSKDKLYDAAIAHFTKKDRRIDFIFMSNPATLAPNVGLLRPGRVAQNRTGATSRSRGRWPSLPERQQRPAEEQGGSAATATGSRLLLAFPGSSLEQPRPAAPLPGEPGVQGPMLQEEMGGGGGGSCTGALVEGGTYGGQFQALRGATSAAQLSGLLRAHPASPCNQPAQRHLHQLRPQVSGMEREGGPPNPRRYCQLNFTVPLIRQFFDGQSDLRVDFRLSRGSFNALMESIGREADHGWDPEIACLVFLFWLASGTSYRVVSRAFDMPRTSVHRAIHTTSGKIAALFAKTVHHPTEEELVTVGAGFARLAGSAAFNKVAGSIDGCHVRVKPPAADSDCYLNRKLFYSVQLQAVVDHTAMFKDVCVGYTGSVHDSRVLKNSPLYLEKQYPPPGYCLIGDGGYPCLSYPITLMTPYRQPLRNQLQAAYNSRLTKARGVVERAFGILKTRWRAVFLKVLEVDVLFVPEVILCCTILHNICLSQGDVLDPEDGVDGAAGEEDPGREAAPPGTVSGAEERYRMASLCYAPDHDYI